MATAQNTIVVDLGSLRQSVEQRVQSGSYASADEVVRAGLLALEREEAATDVWLTKLGRIHGRSPAQRPGSPGLSGATSQVRHSSK